jgi:hypothetical protein
MFFLATNWGSPSLYVRDDELYTLLCASRPRVFNITLMIFVEGHTRSSG